MTENWKKIIEENKDEFSHLIPEDVKFSGIWLAEELQKLSCCPNKIAKILFRCGQEQAVNEKVWDIAKKYLENHNDINF